MYGVGELFKKLSEVKEESWCFLSCISRYPLFIKESTRCTYLSDGEFPNFVIRESNNSQTLNSVIPECCLLTITPVISTLLPSLLIKVSYLSNKVKERLEKYNVCKNEVVNNVEVVIRQVSSV